MQKGAERFGAVTVFADVVSTDLEDQPKRIETKSGVFTARAVVLATGAVARKLEVEGEDKLVGRGVAYCATCDGMLYRDKTVVVVGGGNSAVTDALYLSKTCKKVYLLHRRDTLRASKVYLDSLKNSGVEFLWNSRVKELLYDKRLTGMKLEEISMLLCEAVYQP
ncbi:pyridine nucleotide-disulfide oxidoreductase [[Clostridium] methylpentosum DSM 5476]|uniref:Pyridine nucleotide-disulfide oxidoreductase n=1 Tax=[Clostridium] methylpentosum DSM 5476 TaxID=537013 RepID=C0EG07_9FIRM|nr:pyridine nucleotide-disulfide oxidoreductase [[Clostridium] methylpentosum DSM 5476]